MNIIIFSFLISIFLALVITKIIKPYLNKFFIDLPNARSSHEKPTPSGGGVTFVLIGSLGAFFFGWNLPLIVMPLSLVGLLDDIFKINPIWRYLIQITTSFYIVFSSEVILNFKGINIFLYSLIYIFLAIFCTAIINFINFMDGVDGLVSGCILIILIFISISGRLEILPLISALLIFLRFNWYPSSFFMGDVGSTFLGAVLSGLLLMETEWKGFISILIISSPLLLDSFVCVIRRLIDKQNIFQAHKLHLYQRLHQSGLKHSQVATIYILATAILGLGYISNKLNFLILLFFSVVFLGIWLDKKVAVPFNTKHNLPNT